MNDQINKSPAFQFYPKDFLTDRKVLVMPNEVVGMYIKLLCIDWLEDGFPRGEMLRLSGYDWQDRHGLLRSDDGHSSAIALLSECFIAHPSKDGFVTNPKLQKIRKEQEENRLKKQKAGENGAKARWNKDLAPMATAYVCHDSANGKRIANDSSSSSSSSSSSISNITKSNITEPLTPLKISKPKKEIPLPVLEDYGLAGVKQEFNDWLNYRKEIKHPLSPRSIQAFAKRYSQRPQDLKAAVEYTISSGWQGIQDPKTSNGFKPHTAATTFEKNLEYLRSTQNEPIDLNKLFNAFGDAEEIFDIESGGRASLVSGAKKLIG